jgi:benzaldehyde dehydrogenase (NAD)
VAPQSSEGLLGSTRWKAESIFDGAWRAAPDVLSIREPATGHELARVGAASPALVHEITAHAANAQREWRAMAVESRAAVLRKAAALLEQHAEEIADWIVRETGGLRAKAQFEIASSANELQYCAAQILQPEGHILTSPDPSRLSIARRVPAGVVAVITPWNVPLLLAMRSVAPALAWGNAVVLKPDPQTPVCGGVVLARLFEEAGVPPGVFCLVPGGAEVGEALVSSPSVQVVTFTGSTAVGRRVGELAGRHLKKVALELGGNSPMVVLDDCDIALAASAGAFGSFFHQGQICMATSRHIVHRRVADEYLSVLTKKAAALPVGDPTRPDVAVGPIINRKQIDRVHRIVTESIAQGADLRTGGRFEGPFYQPTVLGGVLPSMPAFHEEIFGPVAPVIVAEDDDHAVELANATDYGLAAAVQTGSLERGLRIAGRLRAGMIHVNDQTVANVPQAPFGGMGQSGNGSRFSSLTNGDEFTVWQWLTAGSSPVRYPF